MIKENFFNRRSFIFLAKLAMVFFIITAPFIAQAGSDACATLKENLIIKDNSGKEIGRLNEGLPFICTANGALWMGIQLALGLAGGVAVLFIILGGFWYMTAQGNAEQVEKGQKTLQNAVIGLVVILMAVVIIRVVINTVTGGAADSGTGNNSTTNTSPSNTVNNNVDPTSLFASLVDAPSTIPANKDLIINISIPQDTADQYKTFFGGGSPANCAFGFDLDGAQANAKNLILSNGYYFAQAVLPQPHGATAGGTATIKLCSQIIRTTRIEVTVPQNVNTRGGN